MRTIVLLRTGNHWWRPVNAWGSSFFIHRPELHSCHHQAYQWPAETISSCVCNGSGSWSGASDIALINPHWSPDSPAAFNFKIQKGCVLKMWFPFIKLSLRVSLCHYLSLLWEKVCATASNINLGGETKATPLLWAMKCHPDNEIHSQTVQVYSVQPLLSFFISSQCSV